MGRKPCCEKEGVNRGAWSAGEDQILTQYIQTHGEGKWRDLPLRAGLNRCGKSCRLRWLNYLRPDIKRGNISAEEEELILRLHKLLGNRWSLIAGRLPGRTDNEIKNYWNTNLSKRSSSDHDHQPSNNNNSKESTVVMKSNILVSSSEQCDHHHQGQVQVIRTKAFKCTKVVIPPHLHTTTTDDQCPLKQEQENSSSEGFDDDMMIDFDINDLFISDDVLKGTKLDDLLMDDRSLIQYQPNGDDHQDVDLNALSSFLNSEINDDDMITGSWID